MAPILFLLFSLALPSLEKGQTIHLSGNSFSFEIVQPEGWVLDTRSAPQVANFLLHPEGEDWREAQGVIFARFVSRLPQETAQEFWDLDLEKFLNQCPAADPSGHAEVTRVGRFEIREYLCPGFRSEVVAVRLVPEYYVVFVLSSNEEKVITRTLPVLERVLSSFRWHSMPAALPLPAPGSQGIDPKP